MQAQITARKRTPNKLVTIVVSPAPVFGHWAHEKGAEILSWIGEHYKRDREAWLIPDHRESFEALLLALAPFEQVVILSGDVHYGFSFRINYLDKRQRPAQAATFLQLTSSSFKNESDPTRNLGAGPWDIPLGAAGPLLAARRAGFLGWNRPGFHLSGSSLLPFDYVSGTPAVARVPDPRYSNIVTQPDWSYRSEMLTDVRPALQRGVPATMIPQPGSGWWAETVELINRQRQVAKYDQMRTVVGHNNMATVSFHLPPAGYPQADLTVHHHLWFRLMGENDEPRPYTFHSTSLKIMPGSPVQEWIK